MEFFSFPWSGLDISHQPSAFNHQPSTINQFESI